MTSLTELSNDQIETVSGGVDWRVRLALLATNAAGVGNALLFAASVAEAYQAGYDGAHGRANNAS